jgi:hypothetical protein
MRQIRLDAARYDAIEAVKQQRAREMLAAVRPYRDAGTGDSQDAVCRCPAPELLIRGGKRAGKSVIASMLFAARVTGLPIYDMGGKKIPNPWPVATPDYPRIYWVIGWDTKHIGQTIYRLLFERGQGGTCRVIRDGFRWRAWNRADPQDAARVNESMLCEPLIPERLLDGVRDQDGYNTAFEWEDKKAHQFNSVRLKNGATIFAFPSSARNPKQGDAVSGIWVDEDIQYPGHLKEWQDRLTDEEGWFLWSVWPHTRNEALLELLNRASMTETEENPQVKAFQLVMTENPFLTDVGKEQSLGRMDSEEDIARRNRGDVFTDTIVMYQFSPTAHQIQRPNARALTTPYDYPPAHLALRAIYLRQLAFPPNWTRYLSMDPSHTRTACHSWVVPPPEIEFEGKKVRLGNVAIAEWELVARRFSAGQIAKALADLMGGNRYESFIIDDHAGRQTHAGRADSTRDVFSAAFRDHKLISRQTSYGFTPGVDVRSVRFRAVRNLLLPQENGMPSLLFVEDRCPETRREFERYKKKTIASHDGMDAVLDEPANPRLYDCLQSTEYFAAHIEPLFIMGAGYVPPESYKTHGSLAYRMAQKILARRQEDGQGPVVLGAGHQDSPSEKTPLSSIFS